MRLYLYITSSEKLAAVSDSQYPDLITQMINNTVITKNNFTIIRM